MAIRDFEPLTARDVARRVGMSKRWVYREAREGRLPGAVRLGRRAVRFDAQAVERYIAAGGVAATALGGGAVSER